MSKPVRQLHAEDAVAKSDADIRAQLTSLANMVEALVRSLSDADVVTRADLYARIKGIEAEKSKRG